MTIQMKTSNHQLPVGGGGGGGDGGKAALEFNSVVQVDMKNFSQLELYELSRATSDVIDDVSNAENDVVPNIDSDYRPIGPITTGIAAVDNPPRRIFAFAHRRGRRRGVSSADGDVQVAENRLILNSLERLVAEGGGGGDDVAVVPAVGNPRGGVKRRRKRKVKNEGEFEGLGMIDVNGEAIDLKYLAREADGVFEAELNRRTMGMVREDEFLGFLTGLDGEWGSYRRRRKYVDAAVLVKALPVKWKILLSLRPRVRERSLYCRRFVSPSDKQFKSCKEVAFYLKPLFATNNANPPVVDLESGAQDHESSHPASKINLLETNSLHKVPTHNVIKCNICRDSFTSLAGLESHMQKYHVNNNQRLHMDALTRKPPVPHGLLVIREPKYPPPIIQNIVTQKTVVENKDTVMRRNKLKSIPLNGEGSSNEQENDSEGNGYLKTTCIICLVEFIRGPVDAETLASSSGFTCPKCNYRACGKFEIGLCRWTQRADN